MCMADTRTMPSFTPLFFTTEATSSVIRMNSCRFFVLNHRYSVAVVIAAYSSTFQVPSSCAEFLFGVRGSAFGVSSQRKCRVRIEVPSCRLAGTIRAEAGGGNHGCIVRRKRQPRDEHR